jgi:hypothetical protein
MSATIRANNANGACSDAPHTNRVRLANLDNELLLGQLRVTFDIVAFVLEHLNGTRVHILQQQNIDGRFVDDWQWRRRVFFIVAQRYDTEARVDVLERGHCE